jgi:hypothetical protein
VPRPTLTIADRYGRAPSRTRRALVAGSIGLVALAALAWFAWAAWSGRASATGTDVGFVVVDDSSVQVTYDVTKPKNRTAHCTVEALDSGFSVVGTVRVKVARSTHDVVRQTSTVRTTNRATTRRVVSCSVGS